MTTPDQWTIHRYATVSSTQAVAASLIARGTPHRTVVVAERQTGGYGRKGDAWQDLPDASLLMTLVLRPKHTTSAPQYVMIAPLACIAAIREVSGLNAEIKWPNDVLLNGRKVAGVLGDATWRGARLEALRLGIGINVTGDRATFAAHNLPHASSIAAEAGHAIDRGAMFRAFLASFARLEDQTRAGHVAEIVASWRASVVTIGHAVVAVRMSGSEIQGVAIDATDDGDLIVTDDAGSNVHLRAAEIRSLRHAD